MHTQFCCDIHLWKDEINRTQLTVGDNQLKYNWKTSTETVGLDTLKIHLNSTILTEGAKHAAAYIGNFYINLKLDSP